MPFDPLDVDTLTYNSVELRRAALLAVMGTGTALGARSGVRPGDPGLTTTLAGSTINVSAGAAWISQSGQGVYRAVLPAAWSGALTAAHATLPRIDLVYLRVWDTDVDASGLRQGDVVYLAGTASSTPSAPAPAGTQIFMPLATISVPASGGGSPSVSLAVRPVTVAPGGIVPDGSATGLYVGHCRDNGTDLQRWNGSGWDTYQKVDSVAWTTPTLATNYTQGDTTTNGNLNGPIRYRKVRDHGTDWMEWDGGAQRTTGSQTANILNTALASGFRAVGRASFVIARNATNITGVSGSTSVVHSAKLDFNQDGTISLVSATAGADETSWFSLRGIRYPLS